MVTNTVTTIIQVVEEILSIETRVQPPAVLEKINNVKVISMFIYLSLKYSERVATP